MVGRYRLSIYRRPSDFRCAANGAIEFAPATGELAVVVAL